MSETGRPTPATPWPILVVGSIGLDSVRTTSEAVIDVLGGSASFFSIAASLFAPVRLVAVVGDDLPPEHRALFEERGVNLQGLQVRPGKTFRWIAEYSGPRLEGRVTLDTQLNVFADFHPQLPATYRDSPLVFLANIQPALQLEVLDQVEAAQFIACDTMKLWLDTAIADLETLFHRVHCVMMSAEEAMQFSGQTSLRAAARSLLSFGPRVVIIKQGEYGSVMFSDAGTFVAPTALLEQPQLRDPTGAGDAFAGGFLGALANARRLDEPRLRRAMLYGNAMGAIAVGDFSVRRLTRCTRQDVEELVTELVAMTTLDGSIAPRMGD